MSERTNRPLWPLVVALVIGLSVLYVLSYGPWLAFRQKSLNKDNLIVVAVDKLFIGPRWLVYDSPDWLGDPYLRYLELCDVDSDWLLFIQIVRSNP